MNKVTAEIDDASFKQLEYIASRAGKTIEQLVSEFLESDIRCLMQPGEVDEFLRSGKYEE